MAVGRISGPLLKDNLLRNGVNLAFETSLLYLDVTSHKIGVNNASPQYNLDINGTTKSTNLEVNNQAQLASFTLLGNTISSSSSTINFVPQGTNGVVYQGRALIGTELEISGNTIATLGTNQDLNITTAGTGQVNVNGNVYVNGDIYATGNITANGNITLGNQTTDVVDFEGEIGSDIVPSQNNQFTLGTPSLKWAGVYSDAVTVSSITTTNFTADNFQTVNLEITGDTISAKTTDTNINFTTSGTGGVVLGNLKIFNNTITNISNNAVTEFLETNNGYVKIAGTRGVVIPVGSVAARPTGIYVETGMMRYNNELFLVEIWNGTAWISVAGAAAGVTANVATDIGIQTALIFG